VLAHFIEFGDQRHVESSGSKPPDGTFTSAAGHDKTSLGKILARDIGTAQGPVRRPFDGATLLQVHRLTFVMRTW
jgi:hypothetical protein